MNTHQRFLEAVDRSKTLPKQPNDQLLKIYALYKQANIGDVSGPKPGTFDLRGKAKYQAWQGLKGMSQTQAMTEYVTLIEQLAGEAD